MAAGGVIAASNIKQFQKLGCNYYTVACKASADESHAPSKWWCEISKHSTLVAVVARAMLGD